MNTKRKFLGEINGYQMSYIEMGEKGNGDVHIILHGSFCNADIMVDYGKCYAEDNHVILIDLPNHFTKSTTPVRDFETLFDCMVGTIVEMRDAGIIEGDIVLHGWSLAGSLVLGIAARTDLISKGIVLDGDCKWVNNIFPEFKSQEEFMIGLSSLFENFSECADPSIMKGLVEKMPSCVCDYTVANDDLTIDFSLDLTSELSNVEVPITILFGENDILTNRERQLFIKDNIRGSKLVTVPGGMHQICVENPELVRELIKG